MIPRRYGQIKRQAGESVALHVDLQDALARFARILMGSRSPTTVRLYVGMVHRWLAYGGAADRLALSSFPLLAPDALAVSAADAVRDILAEAASANTTRSYHSALRYWAAWFQGRFGAPIALPVPEATAVQFIVDHVARRSKAGLVWELPAALDGQLVAAGLKQRPCAFKLSTVVHRIAVLSSLHQLKKQPNPCEQPAVRHLLARARRAAVKRGRTAGQENRDRAKRPRGAH